MTANLGHVDRVVRLIVGLVLLALPFLGGGTVFAVTWIKYIVIAVGIVMLATAAMRICPLYAILGIRTCKL